MKQFVKIPKEVFRKILHMIFLGCVLAWTYGFET
mgnify:FL=1